MPARDFINNFNFDPTTFNFEQFKSALQAEIAADDDLAATKITGLESERDTLSANERDLKIKLFDATLGKKGTPVTPQDSPTQGGGPHDSVPTVKESDIFEKLEL